jgi:hypothetical protein
MSAELTINDRIREVKIEKVLKEVQLNSRNIECRNQDTY